MRWQQNSIYGKNIYREIFYIFSISSILPSPDSGRAHKRSQNICCNANNEFDDLIFLCFVVARERSLFVMRFDCDFNLGTIFLRIAFECTLWRNAKLEIKCFCMQMHKRIYGETHTQSQQNSRSDWFSTGCIIYLQLNIYRICLSTWRTQLFLLL